MLRSAEFGISGKFNLKSSFCSYHTIFSGLSKEENYVAAVKNTFAGTKVKIRVRCSKNSTEDVKVKIGYVLRKTPCWEEYFNIGETYYSSYYKNPG